MHTTFPTTHSPPQTTSGPFSLSCRHPHQKCLRFNPDATIWTAKQQVLCALSESLQDVLNYGLFQPATSGRDANFLEEERLLGWASPITRQPCLHNPGSCFLCWFSLMRLTFTGL